MTLPNLTLTMDKRTNSQQTLHLRQSERGLSLTAQLLDYDGTPYDLTGMLVRFKDAKAGGKSVSDENVTIVKDPTTGVVSYPLHSQVFAANGIGWFELYNTDGTLVDSTQNIVIKVEQDISCNVDNSDYISGLDGIEAQMQGIVNSAQQTLDHAVSGANTAASNANQAAQAAQTLVNDIPNDPKYRGPQGIQGATGATGPVGPAGPAGKDGADGKDGKDGKDGTTPDLTPYLKSTEAAAIYQTPTQVQAAIDTKLSTVGVDKLIADGTDLNTLTNPGNYRRIGSVNASIVNFPPSFSARSFFLSVWADSSGSVEQDVFAAGASGVISRYLSNGSWSDWSGSVIFYNKSESDTSQVTFDTVGSTDSNTISVPLASTAFGLIAPSDDTTVLDLSSITNSGYVFWDNSNTNGSPFSVSGVLFLKSFSNLVEYQGQDTLCIYQEAVLLSDMSTVKRRSSTNGGSSWSSWS